MTRMLYWDTSTDSLVDIEVSEWGEIESAMKNVRRSLRPRGIPAIELEKSDGSTFDLIQIEGGGCAISLAEDTAKGEIIYPRYAVSCPAG